MRALIVGLAALAACGPHRGPTPTALGDDHAVTEGGGWTRVEPGTWEFTLIEEGEQSATDLRAQAGGRGMERVDLPAGATGGQLSQFEVVYTSSGAGTWTVQPPGPDGFPGDVGLATAAVTVTDQQIGGWSAVTFSPPATVDASFFLVFESLDGALGVGSLAEDRNAQVFYQPPRGEPQATPYTPLVRVTLTAVH